LKAPCKTEVFENRQSNNSTIPLNVPRSGDLFLFNAFVPALQGTRFNYSQTCLGGGYNWKFIEDSSLGFPEVNG
jgi:hypothetical protein